MLKEHKERESSFTKISVFLLLCDARLMIECQDLSLVRRDEQQTLAVKCDMNFQGNPCFALL